MKPVNFKHQNVVFAEDQPEYQPLPALKMEGPEGYVITCWKLSILERLRILFLGRIWLNLMSFNQPLTPSYMSARRKDVYIHADDDKTWWKLNVGTKSVLFGAHCFLIHPFFVMAAWIKLYGFPFHPAIWLSFFFHDLGYWGKPNMDGPEGEKHVLLGAKVLGFLFGKKWADFSRYHSRFYAKKDGVNYSRLCVADKLAICMEPAWLYLPRVNWSGEIHEYMEMAGRRKYAGEPISKYEHLKLTTKSQKDWHEAMVSYMRRWVSEHKECKVDTWTPILN